MKFSSEIKLPSNFKFGLFFSFIFFISSLYFFYTNLLIYTYILLLSSAIFLILAIIKPSILQPLNYYWMRLGFFLGKIVNPIVMGIIYFLIISPYGIIIRLSGRDELFLKFEKKNSLWKNREKKSSVTNFEHQY